MFQNFFKTRNCLKLARIGKLLEVGFVYKLVLHNKVLKIRRTFYLIFALVNIWTVLLYVLLSVFLCHLLFCPGLRAEGLVGFG